jgi:large subunit ribosomal protein L18
MRDHNKQKQEARLRRKKHIRKVIRGTSERPRLVVYRSLKNIYAQLVDDVQMVTIIGVSSLTPKLKDELAQAKTVKEKCQMVGKAMAAAAKERGITQVVFDRNGYPYHGKVKALAEGAREGGLNF